MNATEIVKAYYEAFNQKNYQGMLDLLSEDFRHDANQGSSNSGLDYFKGFLEHMEHCYDEQLKDMVFMSEPTGEHVAVEFVVHGKYLNTDGDLPAASGQTYVLPAGAFLAVANGKITRVTTYYNLENWLEQISA